MEGKQLVGEGGGGSLEVKFGSGISPGHLAHDLHLPHPGSETAAGHIIIFRVNDGRYPGNN